MKVQYVHRIKRSRKRGNYKTSKPRRTDAVNDVARLLPKDQGVKKM